MVSRVSASVVIDMLAVGVAMRRHPQANGVMPGKADERLGENQRNTTKSSSAQSSAGREFGVSVGETDFA